VSQRFRKVLQHVFELPGGDGGMRSAVRTNLWGWKPKRLLEWHREKAGSVEAAHAVLKNELAGGVADGAAGAAAVIELQHSGQTGAPCAPDDPAPDAEAESVQQLARGAGQVAPAPHSLKLLTDGSRRCRLRSLRLPDSVELSIFNYAIRFRS
jgi:hypothetical protein